MGHPSEVLRKIAVDRKHGRKETGDGSDIKPQDRLAKDAELASERHVFCDRHGWQKEKNARECDETDDSAE